MGTLWGQGQTAADYYEDAQQGLGAEFARAVDGAVRAIVDAPLRWPQVRKGFRKYRLRRFPYCVIYRIANDNVVEIFAVFHLRRKPGSWRR